MANIDICRKCKLRHSVPYAVGSVINLFERRVKEGEIYCGKTLNGKHSISFSAKSLPSPHCEYFRKHYQAEYGKTNKVIDFEVCKKCYLNNKTVVKFKSGVLCPIAEQNKQYLKRKTKKMKFDFDAILKLADVPADCLCRKLHTKDRKDKDESQQTVAFEVCSRCDRFVEAQAEDGLKVYFCMTEEKGQQQCHTGIGYSKNKSKPKMFGMTKVCVYELEHVVSDQDVE